MSLVEIFSIIIIHFIADFIMQDEKWALGKSKNWSDLLLHTYTYSIVWLIPLIIIRLYGGYDLLNELFAGPEILWFFPITFILHTITDYFSSRIVSKKFEKETPFNLKVSNDMFKEGDIIEHGSTQLIIMKSYINESKVKRYNSIPSFGAFTIIGFDQVLHYVQLFLTYYYLIKI